MSNKKVTLYIRFGSEAAAFILPDEREAFKKYMNTAKKNAIYCREASADEAAVENQCYILRRFAAAQGYENRVEYIDNGESGLSLDRPAFSRLNRDMLEGKIQWVLVVSVSRIGRDLYAAMEWLEQAKSLGVDVVSQMEPLPGSDALTKRLRHLLNKNRGSVRYHSRN